MMENSVQILIQSADVVSGLFDVFFAFVTDPAGIPVAGGTVSPAFAGGITRSAIPGEVFAAARHRHGTIDEQFGNIDNPVTLIRSHSAPGTPPQFSQVTSNRTQPAALLPKDRSVQGSVADRNHRSTLLASHGA
jgi:hypothetical protein